MYAVGSRGQQRPDQLFHASGTITTGGTAQLLLAQSKSRAFLQIQNISDTAMYVKFGAGRATCTISGGVVNTVTVVDGGFGFTVPPIVEVLGGGADQFSGGSRFVGVGQVGYPVPTQGWSSTSGARPAKLRAVLTAGVVTSIAIDDGGAGYLVAPYVNVINSLYDPVGCATASATTGTYLGANGGSLTLDNTFCTTDPVSIFCATTGKAFTCLYAP